MDDSFRVGSIERVGNLDGEGQHYGRVQRPSCNPVLQRQPIQKFHGDERLPVLLANVVNRTDIGVIQCGGGMGFALKTGECLRVTGNVLRQELEGDEPMQPRVLSLVNHTHAATPQPLQDAVMRDGLANHLGRLALWRDHIRGQAAGSQSIAGLVSKRHAIDSQEVLADQSTPRGHECLVNVRPFFVASAQSPELIQPCEGASVRERPNKPRVAGGRRF